MPAKHEHNCNMCTFIGPIPPTLMEWAGIETDQWDAHVCEGGAIIARCSNGPDGYYSAVIAGGHLVVGDPSEWAQWIIDQQQEGNPGYIPFKTKEEWNAYTQA